jgi:pyrroline-5-carboxylate reductase
LTKTPPQGLKTPKSRSKPILLLGAGKMGMALLRGWIEVKIGSQIVVVDPNLPPHVIATIKRMGVRIARSPSDLKGTNLSAIVLAVKPQQLSEAATPWRDLSVGALILSIAAGTTIETLENVFGKDAAIMRSMPNLPAQMGLGISAYCVNSRVRPAHEKHGTRLLNAVGLALPLSDEGLMDAVTAVSGSGPAYVFLLAECLTEAARQAGLPAKEAGLLSRFAIAGAGAMLGSLNQDPHELRKAVTSPGGTTEAALAQLLDEKLGLRPLMMRAVLAARDRGRELGKKK